VFAPCGNGGVILGLHRGFCALMRAGLIPKLPRLVAVQSASFDAVAHALAIGSDEVGARGVGLATLAEGIACARPIRGRQLLRAIRASGGGAVTVTESEIMETVVELATHGIFVEPTAAVGAAGLRRIRDGVDQDLGDLPVVVLTGSGLKAAVKLAELRDPNWLSGESR
jgi:threonine synthase